MKNKKTFILLLQFLLVVASVVGIVLYMDSQVETTEVYVYTKSFTDTNQVITESDIREVSISKTAVGDGFETSKESIVGKYVQVGVTSGQYVYKTQLLDEGEKDVFDTLDLKEYRKISLPIDMVEGLSGNIKKGDKVDLVFTGKAKKMTDDLYSSGEFTYSNTFLQDVLVYSVNTADGFQFEGYSDITESKMVDENGEPIKASQLGIITLAVRLSEVEQIYVRQQIGKISFVGRFGESENLDSTGYVIGDYGPVFTGEASVEIEDIEAFRNGETQTTQETPAITVDEPVDGE